MLDRIPLSPVPPVEDLLGRLKRGPTLEDDLLLVLVAMEELSFVPVVEDDDDADEEGASPVLLPVFILLPALLPAPSPLEPSPPDAESSLMSLPLMLTVSVSSMGRFLLARDDGFASSSSVVPETFLGLLCRPFFAFLLLFFLASSFFFRFGLFFLLMSFDDGGRVVATCDIGAELSDEPRLCCCRRFCTSC